MLTRQILSFLLILLSWGLVAQCPPGDITLSSQADIDAFATIFPNCTAISGTLFIGTDAGASDITNLSGLNNLQQIGGDLRVSNNSDLTELQGLNAISTVGGFFQLTDNASLTNLEGLNSLFEIGGNVQISNNLVLSNFQGLNTLTTISGSLLISSNTNMANFQGLNNLSSIGGFLFIQSNDALGTFQGLNSLSSVGEDLTIVDNSSLLNLEALENISAIGGFLNIQSNDALASLQGLSGLSTIDGFLSIGGNGALTSLQGLNSLTSISGDLQISNNAVLTNLEGLNNVDPSSISELFLENNSLLSSCATEVICTHLLQAGTQATISGNADGCANRVEIEAACNFDCPIGNVILSTQNEVDAFATSYPTCTVLDGDLFIGVNSGSSDITDLSPLSGIERINGNFTIIRNQGLTTMQGLNTITTVDGDLAVTRNNSLLDLGGLNSLSSIGGDLKVRGNDALASLQGLNSLSIINGKTLISRNHLLNTLTGLNQLSSIGGDLIIQYSSTLGSLEELTALTSIDGNLEILFNPFLSDLQGLNNLSTVNGFIKVFSNVALVSLYGIENINPEGITDLVIENNPMLSMCDIESICTYLGVTDNNADISGNAIGCNNRMAVESACNCPSGDITLSTQVEVDDFIITYPDCTEIMGNLFIGSAISETDISDLSVLSGLTLINGYLHIQNNPALSTLQGLENIDPTGITELTIQSNSLLSTCAIESICSYLEVVDNSASISDNAVGCGDRAEVETACTPGLAGDLCLDAITVDLLFGQGTDQPQTSTLFDNTAYAAADTPAEGFDCHTNEDAISNSLWVSFTGDGNTYRLTTVQCDAVSYIPDGNTQMALYSGDCSNLTPVACNDDQDFSQGLLNAEIILTTEDDTNYLLLLDGFDGNIGEFCLEVTQVIDVGVRDITGTNIELFPNPTNGRLQMHNIKAEVVTVFSPQGQRLAQFDAPDEELDISSLPAGVYYLHIYAAKSQYSARVVKVD